MEVGTEKGRRGTKGFTAVHIGAITATCWILLLNAAVGYQLRDDGTPSSLGMFVGSGLVFFIGTGYIALDTAFDWTGEFASSHSFENRHYALYVLYLLWPLICLVVFYVMEAILVLRVLGEIRPMFYLTGSGLLFAIGQIFTFVISTHLCQATDGKINGALFETLFTLLAVGTLWVFWSSITEDNWPQIGAGAYNR
ncbi:Export control protein [Aspergillus sp. HF37]|nr:Export control protein [Aspergillus sp. HF37]